MSNSDSENVIAEGTKWLLEMELINSAHMENVLVLNIYNTSPFIIKTELVTDMYARKMLIFLELNWLGRNFFKKRTLQEIETVIQQALPSFQLRVTDDKSILDKSVEAAKKILKQRDFFTRN